MEDQVKQPPSETSGIDSEVERSADPWPAPLEVSAPNDTAALPPGAVNPGVSAKPPIHVDVGSGETIDLAALGFENAAPQARGDDLVLTRADGSKVVLVDFFAVAQTGSTLDLLLENGLPPTGNELVQQILNPAVTNPNPSPADSPVPDLPATPSGGIGFFATVDVSEFGTPFATATFQDVVTVTQISGTSGGTVSSGALAPGSTAIDPPAESPALDTVGLNTVTLGGATALTNTLDTSNVTPFAAFTIQHPNGPTTNVTVTVTLDDATEGVFTAGSLAASGFVDSGGGIYTFVGTVTAAQTAIRQLAFDPTDSLVALGATRTTIFTVRGSDGGPGDIVDVATTVVSTPATGGAGADTVTLPFAVTTGTVDLAAGTDVLTLANGTNTVTVSNTETINGGTGTDTVTLGTAGAVQIGAVENLTGSGGADTISMDATAFGVLTDLNGGAGADVLALSAAGTYSLAGLNSFAAVETVTTTGATTLTLRDGVDLAVTLANAVNTVTGGTGNDTITGGSAADTLNGGGGNDSLAGGGGQDQLTGGAGTDNFIFAVGDSQGVIGLADVITDFVDGTDIIQISGVADFSSTGGSDFADLAIDQSADRGFGGGGNDTVITDRTTNNVVAVLQDLTPTLDGSEFVISA